MRRRAQRYGRPVIDLAMLMIVLVLLFVVRITWLEIICLTAAYVALMFGVVRIGRAGPDGDS